MSGKNSRVKLHQIYNVLQKPRQNFFHRDLSNTDNGGYSPRAPFSGRDISDLFLLPKEYKDEVVGTFYSANTLNTEPSR